MRPTLTLCVWLIAGVVVAGCDGPPRRVRNDRAAARLKLSPTPSKPAQSDAETLPSVKRKPAPPATQSTDAAGAPSHTPYDNPVDVAPEEELPAASPQTPPELPGGGWRTDFSAARAEATARGVPLLALFETHGCGPCLQLKEAVFCQDEQLAWWDERCVMVLVNGADHPDLAQSWRIRKYPTLLLIDTPGRRYQRLEGPQSDAFVRTWREHFDRPPPRTQPQASPRVRTRTRTWRR